MSAVLGPISSPGDAVDGPGGAGLLLFAPLRLEARALASRRSSTVVVRTGAGPVRARNAVKRLGRLDAPAALAVAGVGGGLRSGIQPGTVVVADRIIDVNGNVVAELRSASLLAANLIHAGLTVEIGTVVSTDRIVHGRTARERLSRLGAVAVDMETAAILAEPWDCPVAVVRAVADTPDRELRSVRTLQGGRKALASLRTAAPVLEEWASAVGERRILLAGPRSFCAGVERAIETVERALERFGPPVYVRRQIVHNRHVVEDLEARGAVFVHELDEVPDGATVVFSAHGVAPSVRSDAVDRSLRVVDATCPLVAKVHHEVNRFAGRGYQVVLIGHAGHDETEGTLGEREGITLIENEADVDALEVDDPDKLAYITQTTLAAGDVANLVGALSGRFPNIVGPHAADICYATQNRQEAVLAMAGECDLLAVIGSKNSSNTSRLVEVATKAGCRAVMVDDERDLKLEWLREARTIGVTAGASAPPVLVERLVDALGGLGPIEVEERAVRVENVNFPLPVEVR
jgi:4-hydroxy-3-methylbut-2-en-1-yl diphosphate reductase